MMTFPRASVRVSMSRPNSLRRLIRKSCQFFHPAGFQVVGDGPAGSGKLNHVPDMIERFIINQPGGAEVVFHLILGLKDDGFGDELGSDKGREDAAGDDHEKKAEDELGTQGEAA